VHATYQVVAGTTIFCPTTTYTAGPNEAAIVSVQLDCSSVPAGGYLAVKPVVQVGAGANTELGWWVVNNNSSAFAGSVGAWSTAYTTLTPGGIHTFKLSVAGGPPVGNSCWCDVTVQIFGT
jgi:hypothetical protein